jgi:hypothetical protein
VTYFRALLLPGLVVAAMLVQTRAAHAECPVAKGHPIYRVERGPIHGPPPGGGTVVQTQTFAVWATGRWTWVGAGEVDSGEAMGQSGCIGPRAMKELKLALARAKFLVASGVVTTCDALPTARVKYAALIRGKRVTTDEPCGIPLDKTTAALVRCAEEAARPSPPKLDALRAICRGKEP